VEDTLNSLYEITLKRINGQETSLSDYKGSTLLIVNGASKCGYTPQYADLQKLHTTYKDRGLKILLFPCNDFLNQEEGEEQEIENFCETRFHVEFDLFEKVKILGSDPHPLYKILQDFDQPAISPGGLKSTFFRGFKKLAYFMMGKKPKTPGGVQWNFHKYLIGPDGEVKAHFLSEMEPFDPVLIASIEQQLNKAS